MPADLRKKLLRRGTMGITPADVTAVTSLGYQGWLDQQLDPTAIDDSACDAILAPNQILPMTSAQLWAWSDVTVVGLMYEAQVMRSLYSARQLFERVVEFWTDHFNVDITKPYVWNTQPVYDRLTIRPNAMGTFPSLLRAVATSPAMMFYLDNQLSTAIQPNQNYARELLELHTLGVDNGYTQQDVIEVARCFTGWGLNGFGSSPTSALFHFDPAAHDNGQKVVLGNVIAAGGGMQDGFKVLDILADHPNTAAFVAKKLARFFHGETVAQRVVDAVRDAYLDTGGDIRAMIRTCLKAEHLAAARPKYKRPFHYWMSILRPLSLTFTGTNWIRSYIAAAGQVPYQCHPPTGYPDGIAQWAGQVLPRWNAAPTLFSGVIWDTTANLTTFFAGTSTVVQVVDRIDATWFGSEMPAAERTQLTTFLATGALTQQKKVDAAGLAAAFPSVQYI